MELGLKGRVAIVVGATEGMGRASALRLAAEGMRVAVVARSTDRLDALAAELKEVGATDTAVIPGDATDPAMAPAMAAAVLQRWDGIDALVNTVGLCEPVHGGILEQDDGYWLRSFDSVLMAAVRTCRAVLPTMIDRRHGAIVNVSAMSARHYLPMLAHYSSQKIALAHFTKNVAKEFARQGVRANAVMPGMIESDGVAQRKAAKMAENGWDDAQYFDYVNAKYHDVTYADRLGRPGEIADAVAWLVSDHSSYVNGAWLPVDGGSGF